MFDESRRHKKKISIVARLIRDSAAEIAKVINDQNLTVSAISIDNRLILKSKIPYTNSCDWLFNSSIESIDKIDKLLIIGCDPKREAAVLNARIRQRWLSGNLEIMTLCTPDDLSYKFNNLGNDISTLCNIATQNKIVNFFKNAKLPMLILGDSILESEQGEKIHKIVV